ncbi:hypothetical protein [Mycobacterium lepromatosis]|uniref:hypothetical protein n=1 Tax=Mycobacterium lepromatosis TaxID=480418 RepID=UPI000B150AE2|nr:hypothetical protein [Mycobacterium lepromatosis]
MGAVLVDTGTKLAEADAIDAEFRQLVSSPIALVVLKYKNFEHILGGSVFA